MRFRIFGSCVTRDAFEFATDPHIQIERYYARSSIASAFGPGPFEGVDTSAIESAFQRRIVDWDLGKTFARSMGWGTFDRVVVDLIDERFDLVRDASGAVATRSIEFQRAAVDPEVSVERIVSGSDEFITMWSDGWRRFMGVVDDTVGRDAILLHRAYWAESTQGGSGFPGHTAESIERANATLDRMYAVITTDLPVDNVMAPAADAFVGADTHKWGPSPFHYVDSYYTRLMSMLVARCEGGE